MSDVLLLQYENKIGTISAAAESRHDVGEFIQAGEKLLKQSGGKDTEGCAEARRCE